MYNAERPPDMMGLQFFGIMSASISHENKNALAVINENAGLLEDLIGLAEAGRPLDLARLRKLAVTVSDQIQRADGIVINMNQFAHSIDEPLAAVDVNEILKLVVALSGRFAAMKRVAIDTKLDPSPVMLTTSPFFLMNLLWLFLDFAMGAAGEKRMVELAVEKTEGSALIRFRGLDGLGQTPPNTFPAEREKKLLALLRAELSVNDGNREMRIKISPTTDG
jgi:C4-dicarboxylate-specific signal transduction histidine kinase